MTKDEAKTKWCPMYRENVAIGPSGDGTYADNRQDFNPRRPVCIGSACMAWRWDRTDWVPMDPRGTSLARPADQPAEGYCGLAGKP